MEKEWIPVIAALCGVFGTLCGAVVVGSVTYFLKKKELQHQVNQEKQKILREKLEDLYSEIERFMFSVIEFQKYHTGKHNQTLSDLEYYNAGTILTEPLVKIRILCVIYAPELFEHYFKFSDKVTSYRDNYFALYKVNNIKELIAMYNEIVQSIDIFTKKLVKKIEQDLNLTVK